MKRLLFLLLLIPVLSFGQEVYTYGGDVVTYSNNALTVTPSTYCVKFQTVYDAFSVTPDNTYSGYWNTMVEDIGTYWDSLDIFNFRAVHNSTDALINWKNPGTYNSTNVHSTAFTQYEGFTGDGANDYLNWNWNGFSDGDNYQLATSSFGCYIRNNVSNTVALGAYDTDISARFAHISPRSADVAYVRVNSFGNGSAANTDSRGFYVANRTSNSVNDLYKNGVILIDDTDAYVGIPNENFYELAWNQDGSAASFSNLQISCTFAGAGLSVTAITTITDAIETCMDAMGKGVIP